MKKKIITVTIFAKISYKGPIKFGEIDVELQPDDEIIQQYEEAFYGSDHGHDPHWSMRILRDRLETDKEFEERTEEHVVLKKELKIERYKRYLKLKKEFENE